MPPSRQIKFALIGDADSVQRAFSQTGRSAKQLGRDVDESNAALDRHDKKAKLAEKSLDQLGSSFRKLFEQTAKIGTLGLAAEGISAVSAAAGAGAAALAPLAGGLAAYPALASAAGQGLGVLKLATDGVGKAVGGLNEKLDKTSKAYKELTPQAQKFARELDQLKKPVRELSVTAQRGLLPGLSEGIKDASKNLPVLHSIVGDTAKALGGLATQAGQLVGSKGFGKDLATQGERNVTWIRRGGETALNLADALRHVVLAAGPLVDWMTKAALRFSDLIDKQAKAGRESGTLASFFHQTEIAMSRVARIGGDLATAFFNIVKAAYPVGSSVLKSLTLNAEKFKDWTESAKGSNAIADFFRRARPAIDETGRLIEALAKTFVRLGNGDQVAPLLATVRTQLLPAIEKLVDSTTKQFMPAFLNLATQSILLFTKLGGTSSPLVGFTEALGNGLEFINHIIDRVPKIGTAISALAAIGGISAAIGLSPALKGVRSLSGSLGRITSGVGGGGTSKVLSLFAGRGETPAKPLYVWSVNGGGGGGGGGGIAKDAEKGAGGLLARLGLGGAAGAAGDFGLLSAGAVSIGGLFAGAISLAAAKNAGNNLPSGAGGAALRRQASREVPPPGFGSSGVLRRAVAPNSDVDLNQLEQLQKQITAAEKVGDPAKLREIAAQIREIGKANQALNPQQWTKLADGVDAFAQAKGWQHAQTAVKGAAKNFQDLLTSGHSSLTEIRKTTEVNLMDIAGTLGKDTAEGKDALARNFALAAAAVQTQMDAAGRTTKAGLAAIRGYLAQELKLYGLSIGQAKNIAKGDGNGGTYGDSDNNLGREGGASQAMSSAGDVSVSGGGTLGTITGGALNLVKGGAQRLIEAASASGAGSALGASGTGLQREARQGLAYVQSHFGGVTMTSGRRSAAKNAEVGGAPNSDHLKGLAIDLVPKDGWNKGSIARFDRIAAWARTSPWIRWIGWRGVPGHGPGNHLHLSFLDRVAGDLAMAGGKLRAYGGGNVGDIGFQGLEDLWVQAGGSSSIAPLMAHVAEAESSGNPNAHNASGASGLWQILGQPFAGNVYDPLTNAKMAVAKYKSQGLGAWAASRGAWGRYVNSGETYTRGSSSLGTAHSVGGSSAASAFQKSRSSARQTVAAQIKRAQSISGPIAAGRTYEGGVDQAALDTARAGDDPKTLRVAVLHEIKLKETRLRKVQKALKRRLTKATRSRLTQEATQLLGELRDLYDLDANLGNSLASGATKVDPSTGQPIQSDAPTPEDFLNAAVAEAALTPGLDDDIAAQSNVVGLDQGEYDRAVASGDPRRIAEAAGNLSTARDQLAALQANTAAVTDQTQALADLTAEVKRSNDIAAAVQATDGYQATKTLADIVSGFIVGRGLAGRAFTPGTGVEVAY